MPAPPLTNDPSHGLPGSDGGGPRTRVYYIMYRLCDKYSEPPEAWESGKHIPPLPLVSLHSLVALRVFIKLGFLTSLRKSSQDVQIRGSWSPVARAGIA